LLFAASRTRLRAHLPESDLVLKNLRRQKSGISFQVIGSQYINVGTVDLICVFGGWWLCVAAFTFSFVVVVTSDSAGLLISWTGWKGRVCGLKKGMLYPTARPDRIWWWWASDTCRKSGAGRIECDCTKFCCRAV